MKNMFNLLAIGDPIIDTHVQIEDNCLECHLASDRKHLCLNYGQKIPITSSFQSLGGNAPNVAVGTAKLGLASAVLSTVGRDAYGKLAVQELKKYGVDTSLITYDTLHQTRYSLVLNYRAERTILSYSEAKNYRWPRMVPPADWVYYTGLSKGFELIQEKLAVYLKKYPTGRLAINPGSYILKYATEKLLEMIARADLLLVNREEAEQLLNFSAAQGKKFEHADVESMVQKLLGLGPKEAVLTDGARGAWAGTAQNVWYQAAFPVKIIAKTGAGDAFSSGYIAARFYGHDIPMALTWGTANSAGVVQAPGPHSGLLDQAGIEKMIRAYPPPRPQLL